MSAFDAPQAGDVFAGVGFAFEAQVRTAFARLPGKRLKLGRVRVVPSQGAAVTWSPTSPAVGGSGTYDVTLMLPAVNPDDDMSRREAAVFAGYAVHELCHVLYTDLGVFQNYAAQSGMHKHVLNALEDPRIERRCIKDRTIPGGRSLLMPLAEYILDRAGADFAKEVAKDSMAALPFLLAIACREYGLAGVDRITAKLPARMAAALRIGLSAVRTATSTADLVPAADAIMALFPKQAPAPQPPQPPQPPQDSDAGEQGEPEAGEDSGADAQPGEDAPTDVPGEQGADGDAAEDDADDAADGDGDGAEGDGDEDDADDADGDDGEGDADGEGDGDDGDDGEGDDPADDADGSGGDTSQGGTGGDDPDAAAAEIDAGNLNPEPAAAADQVAKDVSGENSATFEGEMTAHLAPLGWKRLTGMTVADGQTFAANAEANGRATPVTRAKLQRALRSPRISWASKKLLSGRLDATRLHRVAVDDPAIFIRRGETAGTETALTVLVDASGSMDGVRAMMAAQASYNLAATFTGMRLPCEVAIFKDSSEGPVIYVAKDRDAPMRKATPKIAEMQHRANGGTPDTEAMIAYVRKMARWQEARRVLLVVTDGAGSMPQQRHDEALAEARRAGVQVFGVGIGIHPATLEARYPGRAVAVDEVKELAEKLANVLLKAADEWERGQ